MFRVKSDPALAQVRRTRLKSICDDRGQSEVSARTRKSLSQLGQWLAGDRNMSEGAARQIEDRLGLPRGYLDYSGREGDAPNTSTPDPDTADEFEVIALWRQLVLQEQRSQVMELLRVEAERARRIEQELRARNMHRAVSDTKVARHLPPRPAQRVLHLPDTPPPKKPKK